MVGVQYVLAQGQKERKQPIWGGHSIRELCAVMGCRHEEGLVRRWVGGEQDLTVALHLDTLVHLPAPLLACVTLGKLLTFSLLPLPHLSVTVIREPLS